VFQQAVSFALFVLFQMLHMLRIWDRHAKATGQAARAATVTPRESESEKGEYRNIIETCKRSHYSHLVNFRLRP
jgi:hypothetical protein